MKPCFSLALLAAAIALPGASQAAGGSHVVDDSEVETPGTCHVELWATRFVPGDGYGNVAPACTASEMPFLEMGIAYQHYWDDVIAAPLFGPQFKINLRPESAGLGVGIGLNAGMNLTTGDLGLAQILLLVTIPITEGTRINLNAGWSYLRYDNQFNALFYGAQIESAVSRDFSLMLEVFGRAGSLAGNQVGVRYTPNNGRYDFDLQAGAYFDEFSTRFFTMGVTIRF